MFFAPKMSVNAATSEFRAKINAAVKTQYIPAVLNSTVTKIMKQAESYARKRKLPAEWTHTLWAHYHRAAAARPANPGTARSMPALQNRLAANARRGAALRNANERMHAMRTAFLLHRAPSPTAHDNLMRRYRALYR